MGHSRGINGRWREVGGKRRDGWMGEVECEVGARGMGEAGWETGGGRIGKCGMNGGGGRMGEIGCEVWGRGMGEGGWKAGAIWTREDECRLGCEGVGEFG